MNHLVRHNLMKDFIIVNEKFNIMNVTSGGLSFAMSNAMADIPRFIDEDFKNEWRSKVSSRRVKRNEYTIIYSFNTLWELKNKILTEYAASKGKNSGTNTN